VVAGLALAWFALPLREWAQALEAWIDGLGAAGPLLFAAIYVVATLLLVPAWILTVSAGALFGIPSGVAIVFVASNLASQSAFLLSRYVLKQRVVRLLDHHPKLKKLDRAVGKEGWKAVALMRLSPMLPFGLQNYFYGVTDVKLRDYAVGTALGIVAGTVVYVFLGSSGRSALGDGGIAQWGMLAVGVVATVAVALLVTRAAKHKLGRP
jgi:uncharacterized membrane protein YdjX (TVP38/TMEM64 family)